MSDFLDNLFFVNDKDQGEYNISQYQTANKARLQWLNSVNTGDRVMAEYEGSSGSKRMLILEKVRESKTQIVFKDKHGSETKISKSDGLLRYPGGSVYLRDSIFLYPFDSDVIKAINLRFSLMATIKSLNEEFNQDIVNLLSSLSSDKHEHTKKIFDDIDSLGYDMNKLTTIVGELKLRTKSISSEIPDDMEI